MNILFIHGRKQNNILPNTLRFNLLQSLKKGLSNMDLSLPYKTSFKMPYYGDKLHFYSSNLKCINSNFKTDKNHIDFLSFCRNILSDLSLQNDIIVNSNIKSGLNFANLDHFTLKIIDKNIPAALKISLFYFMKDVYLYLFHTGVKTEIDNIIRNDLDSSISIIIGHSLGSIIAYNILRNSVHCNSIPLLITLGSPLGFKVVKNEFFPLKHPRQIIAWHNIMNSNDILSSISLTHDNFPVTPPINNHKIDIKTLKDLDPHSAYNYLYSTTVCQLISNLSV